MLKRDVEQDVLPPKSLILEFDRSVKKHSLSKMAIVVICKLKIDRDNKLWISLLRKMVIQEKNENLEMLAMNQRGKPNQLFQSLYSML